jgi:hypothetical protein
MVPDTFLVSKLITPIPFKAFLSNCGTPFRAKYIAMPHEPERVGVAPTATDLVDSVDKPIPATQAIAREEMYRGSFNFIA